MAITDRKKSHVGHGRPVAEEVDIAYGHAYGAGARREEAMVASFLNFLAGLWLVAAPFVIGYADQEPVWNDVVFGGSVALLALVRMAVGPRGAFISVANILIGGWLFASAFWLYDSATAAWNDGILGVIVMLLAGASVVAGLERRRMGGPKLRAGRRLHGTPDESKLPDATADRKDVDMTDHRETGSSRHRSADRHPEADLNRSVVGTYASYRAAERAVDRLAAHGFPVEHAAIVAHGVRLVEDVKRPVRYATAALAGLAAGAFAGTAFGALDAAVDWVYPLILTPGVAVHDLVVGAIVGVAVGLALHALSRGRSFSSVARIEARRFDVTVDGTLAGEAREIVGGSASARFRPTG